MATVRLETGRCFGSLKSVDAISFYQIMKQELGNKKGTSHEVPFTLKPYFHYATDLFQQCLRFCHNIVHGKAKLFE